MNKTELIIGSVLASNPASNTYNVAVSGKPNRALHYGVPVQSVTGVSGPKSLLKYRPGTLVLLVKSPAIDGGVVIIGSLPELDHLLPGTIPRSVVPEDLPQAWKDHEVKTAFGQQDLDRVTIGTGEAGLYAGLSSGAINEFGVGYGSSALRSFIRASEVCGVDAFALDNLLRVKGWNLSTWTALGDSCVETTGATTTLSETQSWFINESLGKNTTVEPMEIRSAYSDLDTTPDEITKLQEDADTGELSARTRLAELYQKYEEIQWDHPKLLPRRVALSGYAADGLLDYVVRPGSAVFPDSRTARDATGLCPEWTMDTIITPRVDKPHVPIQSGLSSVARYSNGSVVLSSAKGISLVKTINIPVPYKKDEFPEIEEEDMEREPREDLDLATPLDSAYRVTSKTLREEQESRKLTTSHPCWDVEDGQTPLSKKLEGPDYNPEDLTKHEYDLPPRETMEVDPHNKTNYYQGQAGVFITDDGSVVIKDAYGSSLVLSGGNIYMDAPGDVWTRPGRDAVTWGGRNVIIKGHEEVELVSSNGNLRAKAEKQLSILGGNTGSTGGVHIESKANTPNTLEGKEASSGGITLKSTSFISSTAPTVGIKAEKHVGVMTPQLTTSSIFTANQISSNSVDTAKIYSLACDTINLTAATGKFGGVAQHAETSTVAGFANTAGLAVVGTPLPLTADILKMSPVGTLTGDPWIGSAALQGVLINQVDQAKGFTSEEFKFTFDSSAEYGYTSEYGLVVPQAFWQKRDTDKGYGKPWEEQPVDASEEYTQPHPGVYEWTGTPLRCPKEPDVFHSEACPAVIKDFETKPLVGNYTIRSK